MPGQKQKWHTSRSRGLRQDQTKAEDTLWKHLADKQLAGVKFHRQQSIGRYRVDFMSFERNLVVEVEGLQDDKTPTKDNDERRTAWLEARGYKVLKFLNNEVLDDTSGVLEKILDAAQDDRPM